jgi:hypothetical protein
MFEDSIGRGERQARAIVLFVLVIEALWVFLHRYMPGDTVLWSLQSDLIHNHITSSTNDGFSLIPFPTANVLAPYISWLFSLVFGSEVGMRFWMAFGAILLRGGAMLSLLSVLRVRDASVYYLIPVLTWSGIFFSGAYPYLFAETIGLFLIAYFLRQSSPRRFQYIVLSSGFAIVALLHGLAFLFCAVLVLAIANEQRRSVHLNQGWLSNMTAVLRLVLPGLVLLLLRLISPGAIFTVSTSGIVPLSGDGMLLFMTTVSPYVIEAAYPTANILCIAITAFVILLVFGSLLRAFLLPMEEVSWQSRSSKTAGTILLLVAIGGIFLGKIGFQSQAFLWSSAFLILSGSYSRGPAVRRGTVDKLLNALGFIAMLAAGGMNAYSVNRGAEAAFDTKTDAVRLISQEAGVSAKERNVAKIDVHYVIDSTLYNSIQEPYIGTVSYSMTVPVYLYSEGNILSNPYRYQPKGGAVQGDDNAFVSPLSTIRFSKPEAAFVPAIRFMASIPNGVSRSAQFGEYVKSLKDANSVPVKHGEADYTLTLGTPNELGQPGLALR